MAKAYILMEKLLGCPWSSGNRNRANLQINVMNVINWVPVDVGNSLT